MLDNLLNKAHGLSRIFVWIGGTLILLSALLVTVEVILRKLFNTSIGGADEISGYAFGVATSCLLYTSPSPRDQRGSRMPSSA